MTHPPACTPLARSLRSHCLAGSLREHRNIHSLARSASIATLTRSLAPRASQHSLARPLRGHREHRSLARTAPRRSPSRAGGGATGTSRVGYRRLGCSLRSAATLALGLRRSAPLISLVAAVRPPPPGFSGRRLRSCLQPSRGGLSAAKKGNYVGEAPRSSDFSRLALENRVGPSRPPFPVFSLMGSVQLLGCRLPPPFYDAAQRGANRNHSSLRSPVKLATLASRRYFWPSPHLKPPLPADVQP